MSVNSFQAPIISGTLIRKCKECNRINFKTCLTAHGSDVWCTEYRSGVHGHGRTRVGWHGLQQTWGPIWQQRPPRSCCCFVLFQCIHLIRPMSHTGCLCVLKHACLPSRRIHHHHYHRAGQPRKIVLQFIYEGTPIKYKLASIQISRVGLKSGRLVSWVQGYHKSRRKHDIYVRFWARRGVASFTILAKQGKILKLKPIIEQWKNTQGLFCAGQMFVQKIETS